MTIRNKKKVKFTVKQKRFIDFYDGNATEAARKAGYKGNENTLNQVGLENLRKPKIFKAIKEREKKRLVEGILTREERQLFWSKIIRREVKVPVVVGPKDNRNIVWIDPPLKDRLRASELLGRSEADFTDNVRVEEVKPMIIFDEDER